jgi:hypothetical protein
MAKITCGGMNELEPDLFFIIANNEKILVLTDISRCAFSKTTGVYPSKSTDEPRDHFEVKV